MSNLDLGTLRAGLELDSAKFDKKYGQVTQATKKLEANPVAVAVDAKIATAEKNLTRIRTDLDVLKAMNPTPEVQVDISKAETALAKAEASLDALKGARANLEVTADTSEAEDAIDDLPGAGAKAGEDAGHGMSGKIIAALATIPIAGALVGIGKAIGDALMSGLQNEVRADRFMAQTGLDQATAAKVGRAAGEAYANNFGESIAGNIEAARDAIQSGLLDPKATKAATQDVIEQLTGVSDLLGEDIPAVSRAAAQAIKTGMAKDAAGAFDILVKAQQAGLNVSEDLLDTFNEYGTQFRKLGLDGPQAVGLIRQALQGGARDTDVAADALKEFSIRAVDGSTLTAQSFEALGLSAKTMQEQIAQGGEPAAKGLDAVLDRLRGIKDPAERAQIAVGLFGTQAEDMGDALYHMDLSNAVQQLGDVEGAARGALNTLGDNTASKLEAARRNIEVASDGIKGALATAFAPQIEGFATFVSTNREAVLNFLLDAANGAIDFGRAMVEGAAAATAGLGDFLGGPCADLLRALGDIALALDAAMPGDQHGKEFQDWATGAADSLGGVQDSLHGVADDIRTNLIENGLDPAQEKLNNMAVPMVAEARLHDATTRLTTDIDGLGKAANGSTISVKGLDTAHLTTSKSGEKLDGQIRAVVDSLHQQVKAADESGESQSDLRKRVKDARDAFIDQMVALGLTKAEAKRLADQYGLIPDKVVTDVRAKDNATGKVSAVSRALHALPHTKTVNVVANTREAQARIDAINRALRSAGSGSHVSTGKGGGSGGVPMFADGGYTGPGSKYQPAGIVHAEEFVVNREATRDPRNRAILEAMNKGVPLPASAGSAAGQPATPAAATTTGATYVLHLYNNGRPLRERDVVRSIQQAELLRGGLQ